MNAFVIVAFGSLDLAGAMGQAFSANAEPAVYAGSFNAVLLAILLLAIALGSIDQLIRRHRRQRAGRSVGKQNPGLAAGGVNTR